VDVAVLLVSELFGNSVRHNGSGAPRETVAVRAGDGMVRVEVADRSGPGVPELRPLTVMRKAAAVSSSLRALRRGGAGGGVAGGR
jgi:anti-sigma regulatory factor (Ser/Thr protein kinase)